MKDLLKFDSLNTLAVYVTLITGVCTIFWWVIKNISSLINFSRIKNVKSGIYNGFWIDPIKKEINTEILKLQKRLYGIKITPIYKHKTFYDYTVSVKPYDLNKNIFGGKWIGQRNTIYRGYSLFFYNIDDNSFSGKWIGPKSSGEINSGDWVMNFFANNNNKYLNYRKFKLLYNFKEKIFANSILDNIIKKHGAFPTKFCEIDNIKLDLDKDSFIPVLGKISIPFAQYVKSVAKESDSVLDLGTGTGFYPVYVAKNVGCKVKGVDIDEKTITLARNNAFHNGVSSLTEFVTCDKNDLFSSIKKGEKFDLIIANLPFTRISKAYESRNSPFYHSFAGSINLLEQLILGSQYHIKPTGKLIFCYGDSGYRDLLESIVKISSWEHLKIIKSIREQDDTFYIFELELSEKVRAYYQTLFKEEQNLIAKP